MSLQNITGRPAGAPTGKTQLAPLPAGFMYLHDVPDGHPLKLYLDRMIRSDEDLRLNYTKIYDSRTAYDNGMPASMKEKLKDKPEKVNSAVPVNPNSTFLPPVVKPTINLRCETMLANLPEISITVTDPTAVSLKKALNNKIRELYSLNTLSSRVFEVYRTAEVDGLCISQTVAKPRVESVLMDDGTEDLIISDSYEIDVYIYNTLQCWIDHNAQKNKIRDTAQWATVTVAMHSYDYLNSVYGLNFAPTTGYTYYSQMGDAYARLRRWYEGNSSDSLIPVREYYLNTGRYFRIIGDFIVQGPEDAILDGYIASNGAVGKLPLNFTILAPQMDNNIYGSTLYNEIAPGLEPYSAILNQVMDSIYKNLSAPIYTSLPSISHTDVPYAKRNKIIQVSTFEKGEDLKKHFYQPSFTIEPNSTMALLQELKSGLNMLTRTSDMSYGVQDKQIRNEAAANLIGGSMLRNSSFIVTNFEFTFMNQFAKDVLRLLYKYFEGFGGLSYYDEGQEVRIDKNMLKKIKSIFVENGSTLESASSSRAGKAGILMALTKDPVVGPIMKSKEALKEYMDSVGIGGYEGFLKTLQDLLAEAQTAGALPGVMKNVKGGGNGGV